MSRDPPDQAPPQGSLDRVHVGQPQGIAPTGRTDMIKQSLRKGRRSNKASRHASWKKSSKTVVRPNYLQSNTNYSGSQRFGP